MEHKYKNGRLARVGDIAVHPAGHNAEVRELSRTVGTASQNAMIEMTDSKITYSTDITEWLHEEDHKKQVAEAKVKAEREEADRKDQAELDAETKDKSKK